MVGAGLLVTPVPTVGKRPALDPTPGVGPVLPDSEPEVTAEDESDIGTPGGTELI
ncbi:hypothetical protein K7432_017259, partial [Basidiobolus ranarum]